MGPGDQVGQVGGVVVLEGDGVDLHRQASGPGRLEPGENTPEVPAPGQPAEALRVQGVDGHVDPPDARLVERPGELGQAGSVCRQCQFVQTLRTHAPGQGAEQVHHPLAHQGLATGDPDLADPKVDEGAREPLEFLEGQDLRLGQKGHMLGHAVDAAKVAAVRHRHPQIGDGATKTVHQEGPGPDGGRCVEGRHARPT